MKYGVADYGMNVWDGGCYDYQLRLEELKAIGYNGIERLECIDAADAMEKSATFRRLGMDFATCRGPNPEVTLKYTAALGKDYTWLVPGRIARDVDMDTFIRRSNRFVQVAARFGLKAALHNHLGTRIESPEELDYFMEHCPGATLLLDIGHLAAVNGDICAVIEKYFDRIAAIHFKDVFIKDESKGIPEWDQRLRFCELGAGNCNVQWSEAAKLLKKLEYNKWVLVEHDTHLREPLTDLKVSLDALRTIMG